MPRESAFRRHVLNKGFTFTERPSPIPGDLRMSWGMAILLLILNYSRGRKSNFQKLQFLAHAVRLQKGREEVRGLLSSKLRTIDVSVRVEPSLNRAIGLAHALKLINIDKGKSISLTPKGAIVANEVIKEGDILHEELIFLNEVTPKITDALMKRIWRLEDLL